MIHLTDERPADAAEIETILDRAFGADRLKKTSYRYRAYGPSVPYLRFVAREFETVIGTIRYWPVSVGGRDNALLLGPIAVDPSRRAQAVGGTLIQHSLAVAAEAGHRAVLLVGDVDYYGRFGFAYAATAGIVMPDERAERLLVRELAPNALRGLQGPLIPFDPRSRSAVERGRAENAAATPPLAAAATPPLAEAGRWLNEYLDIDHALQLGLSPVSG